MKLNEVLTSINSTQSTYQDIINGQETIESLLKSFRDKSISHKEQPIPKEFTTSITDTVSKNLRPVLKLIEQIQIDMTSQKSQILQFTTNKNTRIDEIFSSIKELLSRVEHTSSSHQKEPQNYVTNTKEVFSNLQPILLRLENLLNNLSDAKLPVTRQRERIQEASIESKVSNISPKKIIELVIVVDGSDSFCNKSKL